MLASDVAAAAMLRAREEDESIEQRIIQRTGTTGARGVTASAAGPAGNALHHDLVSRVLLALPVVDRLQMLQLSHTWKIAGEDSGTWVTCDLITRPRRLRNVSLSANAIHRSVARAGARLSVLRVSAQDDISEALAALQDCPRLIELEVGFHNCWQGSPLPREVLLTWLPPPPFKLKWLWTSGLRESSPPVAQQLSERTEWCDLWQCGHCSCWGMKHFEDGNSSSLDSDVRMLHGPCVGTNCTKQWLCGGCFDNCQSCDELTCRECTGPSAFECTTCYRSRCSKCADDPTNALTSPVACAVDDTHGATCGGCIECHAVRSCDKCGRAPCHLCLETFSRDLGSLKIYTCGGFCGRVMCERCAGSWHIIMGVGKRARPYCCQSCYDALSDAEDSD
jgi:hypothetical protein